MKIQKEQIGNIPTTHPNSATLWPQIRLSGGFRYIIYIYIYMTFALKTLALILMREIKISC